jgi:GT2 family glycosyltransferase
MAFRREVFASVGLFDERLGAGASGCSEDSEMWYRLLAAGHSCRYEPTAIVFHRHRETLDGLRSQMRAYARGHVVALFVQYWRHGDAGNLRRAFGQIPRWYLVLLWRGLRGGFGVRQRLLRDEVAGWLAGLGAALRLRRRDAPPTIDGDEAGARVDGEWRAVSTGREAAP